MRITVEVPDKAIKLLYAEISDDGWESDPKPITMDKFIAVEKEESK